MKRIKKNLITK